VQYHIFIYVDVPVQGVVEIPSERDCHSRPTARYQQTIVSFDSRTTA